ncbi:uncharacterized protein [Ptychodera flava]|uniref:uncharacterized protein n=1 Tax=Ptychodera flava TaxID=63121 RepID=UPI00396A2C81
MGTFLLQNYVVMPGCPNGPGFACSYKGHCYPSLREVCRDVTMCGVPEFKQKSYTEQYCRAADLQDWVAEHLVAPKFGMTSFRKDMYVFISLAIYTNVKFCDDGRVQCEEGCMNYSEMCDESGDCKCVGDLIRYATQYHETY